MKPFFFSAFAPLSCGILQKGGRNPSSIFADIAAGAESGWDFSSRWIILSQEGTYNLSNIATTDVIPVELNSFMYRMERNLAR